MSTKVKTVPDAPPVVESALPDLPFTRAEREAIKNHRESLAAIAAEMKELNEKAEDLKAKLPSSRRGAARENLQKQLDAATNRLALLTQSGDNKMEAINKIVEEVTKKAEAAKIKAEVKKKEKESPLAAMEQETGMVAVDKTEMGDWDDFEFKPLTRGEKARRDALEAKAKEHLDATRKNALAFAHTLKQIRDKKLYHDYAGGWYEYTEKVWGLSRAHTKRQIVAANIAGAEVSIAGAPPKPLLQIEGLDVNKLNESHFRELAPLGNNTQAMAEVLTVAVAWCAANDGKMTAKLLEAIVDEFKATGKIVVPAEFSQGGSAAPDVTPSLLSFNDAITFCRYKGQYFMMRAVRTTEEGKGQVTRYAVSISDGDEMEALLNAPTWEKETLPTAGSAQSFLEKAAAEIGDQWEDKPIERGVDTDTDEVEDKAEDLNRERWYVTQDDDGTWDIWAYEEEEAFDPSEVKGGWVGPFYDQSDAVIAWQEKKDAGSVDDDQDDDDMELGE